MKNKVVIITGASSGIGKALAEVFARNGSHVVLAARRKEKLQELQSQLEEAGTQCLSVETDVSREEDCQRLVAQTLERFGQIDILINNAGISMRALFEDLEVSVIRKVMEVNFFGMVYCTHQALPHILKTQGSIVNISSIAGYRGLPGRTGYSSSKFAMNGFTESLRTEVMKRGVHVLLVCPYYTTSEIRKTALVKDGSQQGKTPREEDKMMSAEAVAEKTYRAVGRRKRDLVLAFMGKMTVFLNKWMPGRMDKIVYNAISKEADSPFN